jgi:hypothetical protein
MQSFQISAAKHINRESGLAERRRARNRARARSGPGSHARTSRPAPRSGARRLAATAAHAR